MIQIMRAEDADLNPIVPAHGQPAYGLTSHTLKIGDGVTTWENLPKVGEALQNEDYKIYYKEIPENSNLNSYTESGYYYSQSENITEKPYNVPSEFILVVTNISSLASSQCTQYIKSIENNYEYERTYFNNKWTPWYSKVSVDYNNNTLQPLIRTYRQNGASSLGCKYGSEDSDDSIYIHADRNTKQRGIYDTGAGIIVDVSPDNKLYHQGIWDGDPVDISKGGTGGISITDARYNLHVPAEVIFDSTSGVPFPFGILCAKGDLGNTIGQATADNYYWGVDSTATLWGGRQVNRATSPTWYKALMMDGSQNYQHIWSGKLTGTNSITLTDAAKYAALILCGFPGNGDEGLQFTCVPAGSTSPCQFCSSQYWFTYSLTTSGNDVIIKITENPNSGDFRYCWGILRHTP